MTIDIGSSKLTYDDYLHFPEDGRQHEIVNGEHFMNPAPNLNHQTISRRIEFQLYTQIELNKLGWVFDAPVDVQFTQWDVVQPDLVIVLNDREQILTEKKIDGAPNMIIEILSPGTAVRDRTVKKKLYQHHGVSEFWLVDPMEQSIEQLILENQKYVPHEFGDKIALTILKDVTVDTSGLWE